MLLNQCLAISLVPILSDSNNNNSNYNNASASGNKFKGEDSEELKRFFSFMKKPTIQGLEKEQTSSSRFIKTNKQAITNNNNERVVLEDDRQSNALLLCKQLVEKNIEVCKLVQLANNNTNNNNNLNENYARLEERIEKAKALNDALNRIEFAGFVVPSWLLLSGSFTDLHCIKTSWSEGNFKSPAGYRIETIGNIRSVNVDYFGLTQESNLNFNIENRKNKQFEKELFANSNKLSGKQSEIIHVNLNVDDVDVDEHNVDDHYVDVSHNDNRRENSILDFSKHSFSNICEQFSPLEKEILDIIKTHERLKGKEVACYGESEQTVDISLILNTLSNRRKFTTNNNNINSVLSKSQSQLQSSNSKHSIEFFVDCAISELIRRGQIVLKEAITIRDKEEVGRKKSLPQQQEKHFAITNNNNNNNQSIFQNKQIALASSIVKKLEQEEEEEVEEEEEEELDEEELFNESFSANKERRISSSTSNSNSNKSKSTTLDSGIGHSWDLVSNSPTTRTTTSSSSESSTNETTTIITEIEDCKKNRKKMLSTENENHLKNNILASNSIGLPTTTTTKSSFRSRSMRLLHDSKQNDIKQQQQQQMVSRKEIAKAENQASQQERLQTDNDHNNNNNNPDRLARPVQRRGFSLGRSLSFKPRKDFTNSTSVDRWMTIANNADRARPSGGREFADNGKSLRENSLDHQYHQNQNQNQNQHQHKHNLNHADRLSMKQQQQRPDNNQEVNQEQQEQNQHYNHNHKQLKKNLSNLFRSKSMRIISSGKQKTNIGELLYDNNNKIYNNDTSATTSRTTTTMLMDRNHSDNNNNNRYNNHFDKYNQQQATIDYLTTAQQHKRSYSLRRNSLLTSNSKDDCDISLIKKNYYDNDNYSPSGSGGKIVLFLRKLFRIRRTRTRIVSEERIIRQNIIGSPIINISEQNNNNIINHNGGLYNNELSNFGLSVHKKRQSMTINDKENKNNYNKQLLTSPTISSGSSSSGSSSLIEILDCSSAVNSSRHPLREEKLTNINNMSAKTAKTWRCLVKRSESSLSRCSDISSSSTANSTVSQQLRKHLDEAYKRHRNCTNQREKEFIDSINVLRQASRHALQTSPISHHHHHHNRSSSSTKGVSPNQLPKEQSANINDNNYQIGKIVYHNEKECSSLASTAISPTCCCSKNDEERRVGAFRSQQILPSKTSNIDETKNKDLNDTTNYYIEEGKENDFIETKPMPVLKHEVSISTTDLTTSQLEHKQAASLMLNRQQSIQENYVEECQLNDNWLNETSNNNGYQNNTAHLQMQQHNSPCTQNCCICTSYLCSVARLCPLTTNFCSPIQATTPSSLVYSAAPILPATTFINNNNKNHNLLTEISSNQENLNHHKQQLLLQASPVAASDYCCPLWQSMVYNYYQNPNSFDLINSSSNNNIAQFNTNQINMQQQDQQQATSTNTLKNFSGLQQQQQQHHQHNTTIDLKIEIGADFNNKNTKKVSSIKKLINPSSMASAAASATKSNYTRKLKIPVTSSSSSSQQITDDDSLESSDLTDESLNIKLERDSCRTTTSASSCGEMEGNITSGSENSKATSTSTSASTNGSRSGLERDYDKQTTNFQDSLMASHRH